MPETPHGLVYPDSSGHTRTWEHWQNLAESTDDAFDVIDARYGRTVATVADLATISNPQPGQQVWITSEQTRATWNGTEWTGYWRAYAPTLAGVVSPLEVSARYIRNGLTITGIINITVGANGITGTTSFSLPRTPRQNLRRTVGASYLYDTSAGSSGHRGATLFTTGVGDARTTFFLVDSISSGIGYVGATTPWAWAQGDTLSGVFSYEMDPAA